MISVGSLSICGGGAFASASKAKRGKKGKY